MLKRQTTMSDLAMDMEDLVLFCECGNILNKDRDFCEDCV